MYRIVGNFRMVHISYVPAVCENKNYENLNVRNFHKACRRSSSSNAHRELVSEVQERGLAALLYEIKTYENLF